MLALANNARTTLAADCAIGATTLTIQSSDVARFAPIPVGASFRLTLESGPVGAPTAREIVTAVQAGTATFAITRAQEGTTAAAFSAGDRCENRYTLGAHNLVLGRTLASVAEYTNASDGSTVDESPGINAAIAAIYTGNGGTAHFPPRSTYNIQSPLVQLAGVELAGASTGSASNRNALPKLQWNGAPGGGPIVRVPGQGQNIQMQPIRGLSIEGITGIRPAYLIVYETNSDTSTSKVDHGTTIENCALARSGTGGVRYAGGITNLRITSTRFDHISGYAVDIDATHGTWKGVIDGGWTYDTGLEAETAPQGVLSIDGSTADENSLYFMAARDTRVEINKALVAPGGIIRLGINPTISIKVQHHILLDNFFFSFASSGIAALADLFSLSSPTDEVDLKWLQLYFNFALRSLIANAISPPPPATKQPPIGFFGPHMSGVPGSEEMSVPLVGRVHPLQLVVGSQAYQNASHGLQNRTGVIAMENAPVVPTTPTGGGALYVEGGALKFRGSSGTITVLGPA